jgi:SRSO17 transposase
MTQPRASQPTIGFIDQYCLQYQSIFPEVRSYEAFKRILIGIITPSQRKSLSRIAKIVGLEQGQSLHHFITSSPWTYQELRTVRLKLILDWLKGETIDIIVLRTNVRTSSKSSINTIVKVIKLIPTLPHPVFEYKPPVFNWIKVRRVGGQIQ